jgi:DNA-binding CsgD family transcriptional regulator
MHAFRFFVDAGGLMSYGATQSSIVWNEYHRPARIDDRLISVYRRSDDGAVSVITLHRAPGEREFSARERRLLGFFYGEIGRLIGRPLVSATEPSTDKLSPRLRQTLACLLEGDSEKQVAARLGLSQPTTHQYVTALYRHFGVGSRAQLLAMFMKRIARGQWRHLSLSDVAQWQRSDSATS